MARHVVLVSIDGLRPEYYLDEQFPAPTLRQLYLRGAHARAVRTVFPSLTNPDASFALAAAPGFVLDSRTEPPVQHANPGMSHGHHPDHPDMNTGLVAAGCGVRAGVSTPVLPLTAVAPLVAALLGLEFSAPDGEVYAGILA